MNITQALPPAVAFHEDPGVLHIIDQRLLPNELHIEPLYTLAQVYQAIRNLQVRGAPAIGIAAAYGLYLALKDSNALSKPEFLAELADQQQYLASARPTAVNLSWALNRLERAAEEIAVGQDQEGRQLVAKMKAALLKEARDIEAEDRAACRAIGDYGLTLLQAGQRLLTHCNAGHLATAAYGTALAPIYRGLEQGLELQIYCDETRPLLQGARLTAFELQQAGAKVTLLCDNMAASLMAQGSIDSVWVGADRIAANGDTANKIGTLSLAILARHFAIPFYVCAPSSTIDIQTPKGSHIIIEQRPPQEITGYWFKEPMAPQDIEVYNPAFDITPGELISAIITEKGLIYPPYSFY